jgi:transposase
LRRKGFDGLALLVQETLERNPHNGYLFVLRGRRGGLIKVLWHDGQGMCLVAKWLERGRFVWPSTTPREGADRTVTISPAQLGYLLEGIDWRLPPTPAQISPSRIAPASFPRARARRAVQ